MKKFLLLTSVIALSLSAQAQYSLTGTGPYSQDFNTIATGLPVGWAVYSGASATGGGTLETFSTSTSYGIYNDTTCATSAVVGGGFKNYPSACGTVTAGTSCTLQQTATDRAIGVRQVSPSNTSHPNLDSGASFVFQVANTGGITALNCSFDLQSLDTSSPRVTTWRLQYKVGSAGTWTEITPTGTMTTGGHLFSCNHITGNFGTALDNKNTNVYFRIVTIDFSSGTGNRPSTAIDNFKLMWTGSAGINDVASQGTLPLSVVSASTSAISLNFDAIDAGTYTAELFDMTGRKVATQNVDVAHGNQTINFAGLSLAPGMFIAKISNGINSGITKVSVN